MFSSIQLNFEQCRGRGRRLCTIENQPSIFEDPQPTWIKLTLDCVVLCVRACVLKSLQPCSALCNPRTVAHQASLSMGFTRQKYWSGLQCLPPWDLPDPGIEPTSLMSSALTGEGVDSLPLAPPGKPVVL